MPAQPELLPLPDEPAGRDTLVALASAPGPAGVAVLRLSGPKAHKIAKTLSGRSDLTQGGVVFSALRDPVSGELLDRGYVLAFHGPRSFTGEDVAELQVHGSPAGVARLTEACVQLGARRARPGEFTWRALHAGKLDLLQVEALGDLLQAQSEVQHRTALQALDGELSRRLADLRDPLLAALAEIEARLDFAAEPHLAVLDPAPLLAEWAQLSARMLELAETARQGRLRLRGARVVLYGAPNAGKSTLLNALLGIERALVDHRPGTTRDTLEAALAPDGLLMTLIDTAGVRDAEDPVERQGTERARREAEAADVVLWCVDGSQPLPGDVADPADLPSPWPLVVQLLVTKSDLPLHPQIAAWPRLGQALRIHAGQPSDVAQLRQLLSQKVAALAQGPRSDQVVVSRERHAAALRDGADSLQRASQILSAGEPLELVAADLRDAVYALDEITGPMTPDDVLGYIFSQFCIGK